MSQTDSHEEPVTITDKRRIDPETGEPYVFELVREVVAGKGEYTMDVWVDVEDSSSSTFRVKLVTE